MVAEARLANGAWAVFMSERLPQELDDAIKGASAKLYVAVRDFTADGLKDAMPMFFPMTTVVDNLPIA
eukprot:9751635-Lingulodinium_polyedra.AAC.1